MLACLSRLQDLRAFTPLRRLTKTLKELKLEPSALDQHPDTWLQLDDVRLSRINLLLKLKLSLFLHLHAATVCVVVLQHNLVCLRAVPYDEVHAFHALARQANVAYHACTDLEESQRSKHTYQLYAIFEPVNLLGKWYTRVL